MAESLRKQTIHGTIWSAIQRFGTMGLSFIANMVLARMLTPADFGCIGMLAIFLVVSDTFVYGGLGSAIIQKKNATQTDLSTVFLFNLVMSLILYVALFVSAPAIASFYKIPILSPVLRVQGTILIINSFSMVQTSTLKKELEFKKITIASIISTIISVVIAVYMAFRGFGVWALVYQQLIAAAIRGIMLWVQSHWRPTIEFSWRSFKQLFDFGFFIFLSNLINDLGNNVQGLVIGRFFNASILGYFTQAKKLEMLAATSLSGVIDQVTYPALAKKQDDHQKMIEVIKKLVTTLAFITFPLMSLLAIVAKPIIILCYGSQWIPAVPYFQILCFGGIALSLQGVNYNAVAAIGKSRSILKWTIIKRSVGLTLLFIGLFWGIYGILFASVFATLNLYFCNAIQVQQFFHYTIWQQIKDLLPIALITTIASVLPIVMGIISPIGMYMTGILQIIIFTLTYIASAYFCRLECFGELITTLKSVIKR